MKGGKVIEVRPAGRGEPNAAAAARRRAGEISELKIKLRAATQSSDRLLSVAALLIETIPKDLRHPVHTLTATAADLNVSEREFGTLLERARIQLRLFSHVSSC